MARREETVVTEHRVVVSPSPNRDPLCATVFVGASSFTVEFPASASIELGRAPEVDLQLVSGGVSRAHARLTVDGDRASIVDLSSRNGTFVNGTRITEERHLGAGDEIAIGDARLVLVRRAALPGSVVPVLIPRAFVERLDQDIAAHASPRLIALQFAKPWYEWRLVHDWLSTVEPPTYVSLFNDRILIAASDEDEGTTLAASALRQLRSWGIPVTVVGVRPTKGDAAARRDEALHALIAADAEDETTESPIIVDAAMTRLYEQARRIARSSVTVLLVGETGVGKEVLARTIHRASGRSGPLVSVNVAALPETLIESELFGHERGAFSGANTSKAGLIESAHQGTLFLDEIGELPMPMQAKLLRVLEEPRVRRVGATVERDVDVRFVAATNCNLEQLVAERRFRQDLLFRLNASTFHIPPLRERRGEITRLAEEFLARAAKAHGVPRLRFSPEARALLESLPLVGNVRELRNIVERAAALAVPDEMITPAHLPAPAHAPSMAAQGVAALGAASAPGGAAAASPGVGDGVRDSVRDFERQRILDALDQTGGNQTQAAALLGLPRRTLAYKMSRLGIRK